MAAAAHANPKHRVYMLEAILMHMIRKSEPLPSSVRELGQHGSSVLWLHAYIMKFLTTYLAILTTNGKAPLDEGFKSLVFQLLESPLELFRRMEGKTRDKTLRSFLWKHCLEKAAQIIANSCHTGILLTCRLQLF